MTPANSTCVLSKAGTLVELLRIRAFENPDGLGYTFLSEDGREEQTLTYAGLDLKARAIAAWLQRQETGGKPVLLVFPPGLDYIAAFFGSLYAGAIAVPIHPPSGRAGNRTRSRFLAVANDARPCAVLASENLMPLLKSLLPEVSAFLACGAGSADEPGYWREPQVSPESLAFLQYTSGSTAVPRGVMVSHDNLIQNQRIIHDLCGHTADSTFVGWLPFYHDMGIIGNILQPLYLGSRCILMAPAMFLRNPVRWLEAVTRYQAHTSGGPNFAYELCAQRITPEQRLGLDLRSWRVAFNGAEPVRTETLDRFTQVFQSCGFRRESFYPCYGLAEATLMVTGSSRDSAPNVLRLDAGALEKNLVIEAEASDPQYPVVSCGHCPDDQEVAIVNPDNLELCPPGAVGEIWIAGPCVAAGYWNRPEDTKETFQAEISNRSGRYLRTGDLGFQHAGELYVTGRLKDLIIVRGRNVYPQDIEQTAESSDRRLRAGCSVAFSIDAEGAEDRVVIACEADHVSADDVSRMAESIRVSIAAEHQLGVWAVVILRKGGCPKTSSGKVQRRLARELYLSGDLPQVGVSVAGQPMETVAKSLTSSTESLIRRTVCSILQMEEDRFDSTKPLTAWGMDSVHALQLSHELEAVLGLVISAATLLGGVSASALVDHAQEVERASPVPLPDLLGVSHHQRALWLTSQISSDSGAYNIARALLIHSPIDSQRLRRVFDEIASRHAAFRTSFPVEDGRPVQRIHARGRVDFQEIDASGWTQTEALERLGREAKRLFNLEKDPLLRVTVLRSSELPHYLLIAAHHINTDFDTFALLLDELAHLYAGKALPPVQTHYPEYTAWLDNLVAGPDGPRLEQYWLKQLAGVPDMLSLPTDRTRPAVQTFQGAAHRFTLPKWLSEATSGIARSHGATLFTMLLAVFQVLLHRLSNQDDLTVGVPLSGRSRATFQNTAGYCTNPMPVRSRFQKNLSFPEFLAHTKKAALDALEHREYPFALLIEKLRPVRDGSRSPLFQVMFVWHQGRGERGNALQRLALGHEGPSFELGGLNVESLPIATGSAQFDLNLQMAEVDGHLCGTLEYNTGLFDRATAVRISGHFESLLREFVVNPLCLVDDASLLSQDEYRQIVTEWNSTAREFADTALIHDLFVEQVRRNPYRPAVRFEDRTWSYTELNESANRIAHQLVSLGLRRGDLIGVCLDRSAEMISTVMGILKAGSAYVPIEPGHPEARVRLVLDTLRVKWMVTDSANAPRFFEMERPHQLDGLICVDAKKPLAGSMQVITADDLRRNPVTNPDVVCTPADLAYVIFTSGSTGVPKGVTVQHRAVTNLIDWVNRVFEVGPSDRLLFVTSLSFDLSVYDIFGMLASGGCIRIASSRDLQNPARMASMLSSGEITFWDSAPAALQQIVPFLPERAEAAHGALRVVFLSGDWVPVALPGEIRNRFPNARVVALGGATEATVWSNFFVVGEVDPGWPSIPYGTPIQNSQYHILDTRLNPCPIGVEGDLYIGGECLSLGYWNDPQLTARKYIPNPFSERGARLYSTGDKARYLADGNIEFLGRVDGQVKIRGFRIELGEIEAVLSSHPTVRSALVLAQPVAGGDRQLVAYIITSDGRPADENTLRDFAASRLPAHMAPVRYLLLDSIPLTPNGKVDRAALPVPAQAGQAALHTPPANPVEVAIAAYWAEILRVDRVGREDNFFTLGGHSLLVTQSLAMIRRQFGVELSVANFLQGPTVAALAVKVADAEAPIPDNDAEQLLDQLEAITDEDAIEILSEANEPAAETMFRFAPVSVEDCGSDRVYATGADGRAVVLSRDALTSLRARAGFRPLSDYVLPDPRETTPRQLAEEGLFLSESELVGGLMKDLDQGSCARVETMCYLTANRPQLVKRGLGSYRENVKAHARTPGFLVFDDSGTLENREACQQVLAELAKDGGPPIRYADREDKARYAGALCRYGGFPPEVVSFALFGERLGITTIGANRNALLVDTVGECIVGADDDTICRVSRRPGDHRGVRFASKHYGMDLYACANREEALASVPLAEADLLGIHETVLGATPGQSARRFGHPLSFEEASPSFLHRLKQGRGGVAMTLTGYSGDCGWGSPSFYLMMQGASLRRLLESERHYHAALCSREMVQIAERLTVSDRADYAMMTISGIDNRELTPPFPPVGRGEDNLFGGMLTRLFDSAYIAHLPWGVVHAPCETRAFWPGEVMRSASGIDTGFLYLSCLRSFSPGVQLDKAASLRRFGLYLQDLGSAPGPEFLQYIQSRLRAEVAQTIVELEQTLDERTAPAYWERDVRQFIGLARASASRPEFAIPLDLTNGRDTASAASAAQRLIHRFGLLLQLWPDIVDAAAALRQKELRLSRAI